MALIDDSFLAGLKTRRRRITQASASHAFLLSSGRARLFAFEESNTRLDSENTGRHGNEENKGGSRRVIPLGMSQMTYAYDPSQCQHQ